jgi:hypothetical protein
MPLLRALAAAATQMPQLKQISLKAGKTGMFGVYFLSRGKEYYLDGMQGVDEDESENKEVLQGRGGCISRRGDGGVKEDGMGKEVLYLFGQARRSGEGQDDLVVKFFK